jgi:hypothetical protein
MNTPGPSTGLMQSLKGRQEFHPRSTYLNLPAELPGQLKIYRPDGSRHFSIFNHLRAGAAASEPFLERLLKPGKCGT